MIPSKVKIGGLDFAVTHDSTLVSVHKKYAYTDVVQHVIAIDPGIPQDAQEKHLLHEIYETCLLLNEIDYEHKDVCSVVNLLYPALKQGGMF